MSVAAGEAATAAGLTAEEVIRRLGLARHPEGGWYRETFRDVPPPEGGGRRREHRLGNAFAAGEEPQVVVPAGAWQSAVPLGAWTLVGCTVAPAFEFAGFELAPPGWEPT